jgi:glycosyltransferase involved in cell wall biosynthesis
MLLAGLCEAGVDAVRVAPTLPSLPNVIYRLFHWLGRDLHAFLTNYPLWSRYPKADIYHLTSQTLASLLLLRRPKGRVIVTVHDIFPYMVYNDPQLGSPYGTEHLFYRLPIAGLKHADHLIANSQYTKQCVVEHLGIAPEKITVVHLGIEHERFRPQPVPAAIRESYGLPEGRRYLIYVGSEDPRKNLVTLVRALAQLRRELPDVDLIKVGRSHFDRERQRLIELAIQLGVRTAIHFLEDVPEDDLPLLYSLADLCVMPSLYEGFGFPVLEAMACGTPVVYAHAGSLPEIAGKAGMPVFPCDVDTLASTLLALLQSRDKQLLLRRIGLDQAARFTWTATIQSTAAVYGQLIHAAGQNVKA